MSSEQLRICRMLTPDSRKHDFEMTIRRQRHVEERRGGE